MALVKLVNPAPATEALIHIYKGRIVLNARAASLMLLQSGDRISVDTHDVINPLERRRIFIGKVPDGGFRTASKGNGLRVSSAVLSKALADGLEGYGTYKISEIDIAKDFYGRPHYLIFWKKYD